MIKPQSVTVCRETDALAELQTVRVAEVNLEYIYNYLIIII